MHNKTTTNNTKQQEIIANTTNKHNIHKITQSKQHIFTRHKKNIEYTNKKRKTNNKATQKNITYLQINKKNIITSCAKYKNLGVK